MGIEPLIFELSSPGRSGASLPACDVPETPIPEALLRRELPLPEVTEVDAVRHFIRLSQMNYGVDTGFYPLGSCTMKYNPKANEAAAAQPGFLWLHPLQDPESAQGALELMHRLQSWIREIGGFAAVSLQPAAGAHGELAGILIMRKWFRDRGERERTRVLVPDSAHGTNPASCAMGGFEAVEIPSDARGNLDIARLKAELDGRTAGLMLTNPNTLGLFEENLPEIARLVHEAGGLLYGDGANFNALLGICRPGAMGIDIMHFNLHKTFSTPHGGGGPGSCAVGVSAPLSEYLPGPLVEKSAEGKPGGTPSYRLAMPGRSIGRLKCFHGQFAVAVRAYA